MPYNVICLTCTVVALAFGPLHNITTKSLTKVEPNEIPPGLLAKIKNFIKAKFTKKVEPSAEQKFTEEVEDHTNDENLETVEEEENESKKDKWFPKKTSLLQRLVYYL